MTAAIAAGATATEPGGSAERQLLARAKRLTMQMLGLASKKYGKGLSSEQEVVGRLADMAIEVYALESAILRAEKMQKRGGGHAATALDIVAVFAADAADRLGIAAKNALATIEGPDAARGGRSRAERTAPRSGRYHRRAPAHRRRRDRGGTISAVTVDRLTGIIGQEMVSPWREVTQDQITQFADITGDRAVDPRRRRSRRAVSRRLAAPSRTASSRSRWPAGCCATPWASIDGARMGINYGLNKVRFPAPLPAGSRVRGRCTLQRVDAVDGGVQATWSVLIERDGSAKPCCAAEWLVRYYQ